MKFFYKNTLAERFRYGPHHGVISQVLDDVFSGKRKRLIINVPPGFTKTDAIVTMGSARGFARFPQSRFLHASFSDPLVRVNSNKVRDIIRSPEYQALWPMDMRQDSDRQDLWKTTRGGEFLAKPADGPITGFRAGRMDANEQFTGALLIDDPLKPLDAFSKTKREKVNNNFNITLRNRIMREEVPIIVIMQRLHQNDMCGFLLQGGSGDYWEHLCLPVMVDNAASYPSEYSHGIPIEHGLPDGPLWAEKVDEEANEKLKADEFVYWSQYMQNPMVLGGSVWKRSHLQFWGDEGDIPNILYRIIFADTAQKDGEENDYSVFQCWGLGTDHKAYLLDQLRGKWLAPDLQKNAETFWAKHSDVRRYPRVRWGALRVMKIEDKVSGTTLLQSLRGIPVEGIPRTTQDKYMRALDVVPAFNSGLVLLPAKAPWLSDYLAELLAFPGGNHDDQVDPTMDAVADLIGTGVDMLELL